MPLRNGGGMKTESWEKILANVYEDLSNVAPRPIRLAGTKYTWLGLSVYR